MDYTMKMLEELQKLENLSVEYKGELRYLSKKIRKDFWIDNNVEKLSSLLMRLNIVFDWMTKYTGYFELRSIIQYVKYLSKYGVFVCPHLDGIYFNELINKIQIENARLIIEEQWKDVNATEDGLLSFIEIFDDIFTKCIELHSNKFFYKLKETDILCRVVSGWKHDKDRFIPWVPLTNNRWNPPGKTYLYVSFSEKEKQYSEQLSLNEYICLEEYRAIKGNHYSFCHFKPLIEGNILDLSYKDVSLGKLKMIVDDYQDKLTKKMFTEIMSDPLAVEKYRNNKKKLIGAIKKLNHKYPVDRNIIEESYAKQYLKMICSCIYKKVDENDERMKEAAYKSFHILAEYLESKGVTGIIYPCTRTNKVSGKNLVLFRKEDAEPIDISIREIVY
ncbi:hypothetical protein [Anaerocolumna sp.]|uniref:hypothetical protein n=1 Tax=Anaerocolumna sp. TaxID=2041569 RepID=UPI0028B265A6|nr:hypothetical protein [Anaerocolumna sp.]